MGGILTWRDVAAPDFSGANQGVRTAGDLFRGAIETADKGLTDLQKAQQLAADRAILGRAQGISDPDQYAKALAAGDIVGPDGVNASPEALQAIQARQAALLDSSVKQFAYGRQKKTAGELDRLAPTLSEAATQMGTDPATGYQTFMGAKPTDFEATVSGLGILNKLEPNPAHLNASFKLQDRRDLEQAYKTLNLLQSVGDDKEKQAKIMAEQDPKIQFLTTQLGKQVGESFDQTILGTKATFGVDPATSGMRYGYEKNLGRRHGNLTELALANGAPPPPGEGATMGQVYDWNQQNILPVSVARGDAGGKGTTATGPGQITNATRADFAQRIWGDKWRDQPWTLDNESKLMSAIYKDQGPRAWEATKNYAAFKDPQRFEGHSYKDVEPLLMAIDGGVLPDNHQTEISSYQDALQLKLGNLTTGAKIIRSSKPLAGQDLATAAKTVAKTLGTDNQREVEYFMRKTLDRARAKNINISEAEIGGLLLNSLQEDKAIINWSNFDDNTDVIDSKLQDYADTIKGARLELSQFEDEEAALKKLTDSSQQYSTAEAEALRSLEVAKVRPNAGDAAIEAFKKLRRISDGQTRLLGLTEENIAKRKRDNEAKKILEENRRLNASKETTDRAKLQETADRVTRRLESAYPKL